MVRGTVDESTVPVRIEPPVVVARNDDLLVTDVGGREVWIPRLGVSEGTPQHLQRFGQAGGRRRRTGELHRLGPQTNLRDLPDAHVTRAPRHAGQRPGTLVLHGDAAGLPGLSGMEGLLALEPCCDEPMRDHLVPDPLQRLTIGQVQKGLTTVCADEITAEVYALLLRSTDRGSRQV